MGLTLLFNLKIMKNINKIFAWGCALTLTLICSCKNTLELTPISSITTASFWKTKDDAMGALTGMYADFRGLAVTIYRSEIRSELYEGGVAGTGADFAPVNNNVLTPATPGYPDWITYYKVINDANLLLKYVPTIAFSSDVDKNEALAEAHAMRAYLYFTMTQVWGDLIIRTDPVESSDPGVTSKPRSSRADVFTFIKQDIETALSLFPNNNFQTGRIRWSRAATNAMKAEVYLWTGKRLNGGTADFNTALNATNQVETADTQLLPNYADVFAFANKGNKEILMAIRNDLTEGGAGSYFMFYTWGGVPPNTDQNTKNIILPTGNGLGLLTVTKLVRDQFLTSDSRRAASFFEINSIDPKTNVATFFTTAVTKFSGNVTSGTRQFFNDAILYRLADVILMRAEAKNALGQDPSTEINRIRQRAFGANFSSNAFVNGTPASNDDAILKERLLELAFEGKRWNDLVRFNKAFDIIPNLQARKDQNNLLLFPLSLNVLSVEPLVKQNPGY